jgi:transcriptional regulator of acetoin/glycerol metabolism
MNLGLVKKWSEMPQSFASELLVFAPAKLSATETFLPMIARASGALTPKLADREVNARQIRHAHAVLAIYQDMATLSDILAEVVKCRRERNDGTPVLIIALGTMQLTEFGAWLHQKSVEDQIEGIRLILTNDPREVIAQLPDRLAPVLEANVIKMPISSEVANSGFKYYYAIDPKTRALLPQLKGMAENGVTRVYLLGAPGAGKTSLAYYYSLCRNRGYFVTVNLASEGTGDKAAMKSLLCGHVTGAFPGAAAREGAFSFAKDGVAFLDEGHGVTGVLMEVLMEALDSNQYMPYGATAKRPLECAVLFASNRSWEYLRSIINIDQHARLGAMIVKVPDLAKRHEDMIAVLATTLSKFATQCTTWDAPAGISDEAWEAIKACPWRGNVRALMRVLETATVNYATRRVGNGLLQVDQIQEGISLWDPVDHESYKIYASG